MVIYPKNGKLNLRDRDILIGDGVFFKKHRPPFLKKPLKILTNKPFVTMINCSLKYKGFDEEEYVFVHLPERVTHRLRGTDRHSAG